MDNTTVNLLPSYLYCLLLVVILSAIGHVLILLIGLPNNYKIFVTRLYLNFTCDTFFATVIFFGLLDAFVYTDLNSTKTAFFIFLCCFLAISYFYYSVQNSFELWSDDQNSESLEDELLSDIKVAKLYHGAVVLGAVYLCYSLYWNYGDINSAFGASISDFKNIKLAIFSTSNISTSTFCAQFCCFFGSFPFVPPPPSLVGAYYLHPPDARAIFFYIVVYYVMARAL